MQAGGQLGNQPLSADDVPQRRKVPILGQGLQESRGRRQEQHRPLCSRPPRERVPMTRPVVWLMMGEPLWETRAMGWSRTTVLYFASVATTVPATTR